MEDKLEIRAESSPWRSGIDFLIREGKATADPILMVTREEGFAPYPTFKLSQDKAQVLMDDLWQAGLRPTEGAGSAGALAATQRHLDDMRKLTFELTDKLLGKGE